MKQLRLLDDSQVYQKDRPNTITEEQLDNFYKENAKFIIKNEWSDDDEEFIIKALKRIAPFNDNGYELAKDLERDNIAYFDIDVDFISWLDDLNYNYNNIKRQNVKDWVKAHNPKPKFEIGTELNFKSKLYYKHDISKSLYVTGYDSSEAKYILHKDPNHQGGTLVEYEEVEKLKL